LHIAVFINFHGLLATLDLLFSTGISILLWPNSLTYDTKLGECAVLVAYEACLGKFVVSHMPDAIGVHSDSPLEHSRHLDVPNFAFSHHIEYLDVVLHAHSQVFCAKLDHGVEGIIW